MSTISFSVKDFYLVCSYKAKIIVNSVYVNDIVIINIILAGIVVGIQSYPQLQRNPILIGIDYLIFIIFVLEGILKVVGEGFQPYRHFTGPDWKWNSFDFIVIIMSLPNLEYLFHDDSAAIFRLLRLIRLGKIVQKIPQLQMIIHGFAGGFDLVGYVFIFLALVFYIYAVLGHSLFRVNDPFNFGTLSISFLTLFRLMVIDAYTEILFVNTFGCDFFGDGYSSYVSLASETPYNSLYWCISPREMPMESFIYFISFIMITAFIILSLFIGAVTMSMEECVKSLKRQLLERTKKKKLENRKHLMRAKSKATLISRQTSRNNLLTIEKSALVRKFSFGDHFRRQKSSFSESSSRGSTSPEPSVKDFHVITNSTTTTSAFLIPSHTEIRSAWQTSSSNNNNNNNNNYNNNHNNNNNNNNNSNSNNNNNNNNNNNIGNHKNITSNHNDKITPTLTRISSDTYLNRPLTMDKITKSPKHTLLTAETSAESISTPTQTTSSPCNHLSNNNINMTNITNNNDTLIATQISTESTLGNSSEFLTSTLINPYNRMENNKNNKVMQSTSKELIDKKNSINIHRSTSRQSKSSSSSDLLTRMPSEVFHVNHSPKSFMKQKQQQHLQQPPVLLKSAAIVTDITQLKHSSNNLAVSVPITTLLTTTEYNTSSNSNNNHNNNNINHNNNNNINHNHHHHHRRPLSEIKNSSSENYHFFFSAQQSSDHDDTVASRRNSGEIIPSGGRLLNDRLDSTAQLHGNEIPVKYGILGCISTLSDFFLHINKWSHKRALLNELHKAMDTKRHLGTLNEVEPNVFLRNYEEFVENCKILVDQKIYSTFITFIIIITAIIIGFEGDTRVKRFPNYNIIFTILNYFIAVIFSLEVVLRIISVGTVPWMFFRDTWNRLDFIVAIISFIPQQSEFAVLRLLRILRLLRLATSLPYMTFIMRSLSISIRSFGYIIIIIFIVFYMSAYLSVIIFQKGDPLHFGQLHLAMLTLFRMATLDNWSEIVYINMYGCDVYPGIYFEFPNACNHPIAFGVSSPFFFILFTISSAHILLTLFIGAITTSMEQASDEMNHSNIVQKKLKKLTQTLHLTDDRIKSLRSVFDIMDIHGGGQLDEEELKLGLEYIGDDLTKRQRADLLLRMNQDGAVDFFGFVAALCDTPEFIAKTILKQFVPSEGNPSSIKKLKKSKIFSQLKRSPSGRVFSRQNSPEPSESNRRRIVLPLPFSLRLSNSAANSSPTSLRKVNPNSKRIRRQGIMRVGIEEDSEVDPANDASSYPLGVLNLSHLAKDL